jgi:hypothetical protein
MLRGMLTMKVEKICLWGVETSHLTGKSVTVTNAPFDPHGAGRRRFVQASRLKAVAVVLDATF